MWERGEERERGLREDRRFSEGECVKGGCQWVVMVGREMLEGGVYVCVKGRRQGGFYVGKKRAKGRVG